LGGSNSVTASSASVTIGGHVLTAAEIPKHTHGTISDWWGTTGGCGVPSGDGSVTYAEGVVITNEYGTTASVGGGESHTHTGSFAGTASQDKRPPFHALAFIMKGAV